MGNCRFCGARLFDGAIYCARCLAPIRVPEEDVTEGFVEVAAAGGRWRDPGPTPSGWKPAERLTAPAPEKVHSRWRGGATSFGAPTKIAITTFMVLVPVLMWKVLGMWAIEFGAVWVAVLVPRVLRDLWRRSRVL